MRVENKFSFYCLCVTIQPTKTVADTCQYTKSFKHLTKTVTFIVWIKVLNKTTFSKILYNDYQEKSNKKLWFFNVMVRFSTPILVYTHPYDHTKVGCTTGLINLFKKWAPIQRWVGKGLAVFGRPTTSRNVARQSRNKKPIWKESR